MGFSEDFCLIVSNILEATRLSVLLNGQPDGFFSPTCGVRLGDPLSPALFAIVINAFSQSLKDGFRSGRIEGFSMPRHCHQVTHLAYADDIVIFTTTRKGSLRQLSGCIDSFLAASGLSLNQQKSSAIHAKSAQRADRARVKRILGFGSARLPLLYLGCWLDCGRSRGRLFLPLIDRIKARITAWQHNFLSLGGKKVLINSVLSSMSGFIAAALSPPRKSVAAIHSALARFFWGKSNASDRHHWVAWHKVARPVAGHGLGLINFGVQILAYSAKLWWRLLHCSNPWTKYVCQAYLTRRNPFLLQGCISPGWRRLVKFRVWLIHELEVRGEGPGRAWADSFVDGSSGPSGSELDRVLARFPYSLDLVEDFHVLQVWLRRCLDSAGHFSFATAYDTLCGLSLPEVHQQHDNTLVWHPRIPEKISIFMWRLFNNALPLPANLQKIHISLASKCPFCPEWDTLDHIFWQCPIINPTWKWFCRLLGVPYQSNLFDQIQCWWSHKASINSLAFSILGIVCWSAWKARNAALYSDRLTTPGKLQWETQHFLASLYCFNSKKLLVTESLHLRTLGLL
ncbi:hypothetical protein HPP92_027425 [Vanilla planifolia]|uniref:Reverse transcriptase domain-containing protein n=1 Tax=Vanilla planifolia TaxID=51239 RepID=A0A835PA40_VANPL|nr:hypothetical protein HPP92_027425 [Vanilla planifolia]